MWTGPSSPSMRFMELDIDVYINKGILFLDYGYVRVGDIYKLMDKLEQVIEELPRNSQGDSKELYHIF